MRNSLVVNQRVLRSEYVREPIPGLVSHIQGYIGLTFHISDIKDPIHG